MLARTIDKYRATLPGGNLGDYSTGDMSAYLLCALGVSEASFREVVARAENDSDIERWLSENANLDRAAEINRELSSRKTDGKSYAVSQSYGLTFLFDVLEYDDREVFGLPQPVAPRANGCAP